MRQPVVGDGDEILDADSAEAVTIEAGLDGHDVTDDQLIGGDLRGERVLVDVEPDTVAGAVEEPVAQPGVGRTHLGTWRRPPRASTPAPTAASPAS